MDESMEDEDSLLSSSSFYPTARGGPPPILPTLSSGRHQDASFDYPPLPRRIVPVPGRVPGDQETDEDEEDDYDDPVDEEAERAEGEDEEEADDDNEGYAESDTSSAMFDPDADPEGFAKRLDELAGVKEIGEEEMRALKWGPPISRGADGKLAHSPLPLEAFRKVIDHYLTSTEWKYANTPGGAMHGHDGMEIGLTGMKFDSHPISVFGQSHDGERDSQRAFTAGPEGSALGIEGLPMATRVSPRKLSQTESRHLKDDAGLSDHRRSPRTPISASHPPLQRRGSVAMREVMLARATGVAVVLALALSVSTPGTQALAVSQRRSDPFLIGPPGEIVAAPSTDDKADDGDSPSTTPTTAARVSHTSKASSTSISTSTSSSTSAFSASASSSSTYTSASSTSPSVTTSASALAPTTSGSNQPDSIKYLVPVFLFILITLGGWLFSRWYARRKVDEYEEEEYERGKWKQLKDADADEKDPWYSGDSDREADEVQWQDVELVPARSTGAISAAGRGWGWRSTVNAWKSARGRAEALSDEETDEMGQRKTIKLIPALPSAQTHQTLPDLSGRPMDAIPEERGSIRALRDKIASLTYGDRDQDATATGKLDRNRSPNKRRGGGRKDCAPPEAPAWIQPRATSPTQALSPPMQPHLFFHPTPSAMSLHGIMAHMAGSESGSDYGTDDESHVSRSPADDIRLPHARFPTIPSTATALASSNTALPPGRWPRRERPNGTNESIVDGYVGGNSMMETSTARRSQLRRAKTAVTSTSRPQPAAMIRRSTALPDIVNTPATVKLGRSATTQGRPTPSGPSPRPARRKRSKAQRKAEKAHDKVEDILKASWSDRALASPTSCMSLDGAMSGALGAGGFGGGMSPGVEEAAVFGGNGGGIEQRLAMLKNLDT